MELKIDSARRGDIGVLTLTGEVDIYTSPVLKNAIAVAVADGCSTIVIDLNGVGFIDSSGLGVLVGALKRIRERGGDFPRLLVDLLECGAQALSDDLLDYV